MAERLRTHTWLFAAGLALVLLIANVAAEPTFGEPGNWPALLAALAPFAIVAMASTPAILAGGGGLDISIGPLTVLMNVVLIEWLLPGGSAWVSAIEAIPPAERHLVTHEGHLVRLTAVDEEAVALAADLLPQFTFSGTAEQLRTRVAEYEAGGVTELVYQPAGPDLAGELERVMDAVGSASS